MKKRTKPTKTPPRARAAWLTKQDRTAVVGGTGGTIISENALPDPQGGGDSGRA